MITGTIEDALKRLRTPFILVSTSGISLESRLCHCFACMPGGIQQLAWLRIADAGFSLIRSKQKVMDQAITQWINAMAGHSHPADTTMIWITQYGVPILVLLVVTQWWSQRERLHVRHTCIAAGLSFLLGLGVNQIILVFLHRVRPYEVGLTHLIISPSADSSFPSDHATATFAIASAFLLCRLPRLGFAFLAGAFLICFSRIYVGTHYFTDVLGGTATGVFAAVAVNGLYREGTQIDRLITGIL